MEDEEILIRLLKEILGTPIRSNEERSQYGFDCPVCSYEIKNLDEGDGKGNLEINTSLGVYKCWVCNETHGTRGTLKNFFRKFGTPKQKKLFNTLELEFSEKKPKESIKISLPKEFKSFMKSNKISIDYKRSLNYLKKRGITNDIIEKFNLGFCTEGEYGGRIIIPSFDKNNELNYFVGRSWYKRKDKYKNPDIKKDNIIFNESNIDFNQNIYLVEGVFDMFFINNSIPLLGKFLSNYLIERLYNEAKKDVIVVLDGDAYENGLLIYNELNSGKLRGRIKLIKLPFDSDPASLEGKINEYITEIF